MKKVFMTWMTLCLTVVAFACGSNDPEEDGVTSANTMKWMKDWNVSDSTTSTCSCCIIQRPTMKKPIRPWSVA